MNLKTFIDYRRIIYSEAIPTGELLEGDLPGKKLRMLQAWIDIHEEELMADWSLASRGEPVFPIEPLR